MCIFLVSRVPFLRIQNEDIAIIPKVIYGIDANNRQMIEIYVNNLVNRLRKVC